MTSKLVRTNDTITILPQTEMRTPGNLNGASYTFTDTAGILSAYSYNESTDIHTFETNTIAVGNETYSFITSANFTGPKWTTPLTYSDGSPVLAGDAFHLLVRYTNFSPDLTRSYLYCTGVVQNPTSTVLGNLRGSGIYCAVTSTGTIGVGGWASNLSSLATVASMVSGNGSCVFGGGPYRVKGGCAFTATSDVLAQIGNRQDGGVWNIATTDQLSLFIGVGSNGAIATTGGTTEVQIKYGVVKLS